MTEHAHLPVPTFAASAMSHRNPCDVFPNVDAAPDVWRALNMPPSQKANVRGAARASNDSAAVGSADWMGATR